MIKRFETFHQKIKEKPQNESVKLEDTIQQPQEKNIYSRRAFIDKTIKGFTALAGFPVFENLQHFLNQANEQKWRTDMNQLLQSEPLKILEYADKIKQFNWAEKIVVQALSYFYLQYFLNTQG